MRRSTRSRCALILAAAGFASVGSPLHAADKYWNKTGSGTWATGSNWSPTGMPVNGDTANIGHALMSNSQVYLNVSPTISNMLVTNGMFVDTRGYMLQVTGTLNLAEFAGNPSRLMLRDAVNPFDLHVKDLHIANGSDIWSVDNPTMFITGKATLDQGSAFFGGAVINFTGDSGPVLVIDGKFVANGVSSWTLNQLGAGKIDLDGTSVGDNFQLNNHSGGQYTSFTVNGTELNDAFDDIFWLGQGNKLNMNLSGGWTLGGSGKILMKYQAGGLPAEVNGGTVTLYGDIEFEDFNLAVGVSEMAFNAPAIINSSANVKVGGRDKLDFNNTTVINGGTFVLSGQGNNNINFNAATQVKGGSFTTNAGYTNSFINFNAATTWSGTINFNGDARQNGNATVNTATVINARKLDMDGATELAKWTITAPLTINAQQLDINDSLMSGTIDVISSLLSPASLTVNLPAGAKWIAGGRLNLTGSTLGPATTLAGSDVGIAGEMTVSKHNSVAARVDFEPGSLTTINADSSVFLDGGTLANPNAVNAATIAGPGKLRLSNNKALHGTGTIAAGIDMAVGSELRAKDGTLNITGPITSVGVIGTANAASTINIPQAFDTAVAARLDLNGGTVTGLTLTNGGETRGKGTIVTTQFSNPGTINVIGSGTLTINSGFLPDLDGASEGGVINVTGGNLRVTKQLADAFNGTLNIKEGQLVNLEGGWTLGPGGNLNAEVGPSAPGITALILAPSQNIAGNVNVPNNASMRFNGKTTFEPTSVTTLATAFSELELYADGTIAAGATFVTPTASDGAFYVSPQSRLHLANGANVQARLKMDGTLSIAGAAAGTAAAELLELSADSTTEVTILGPAAGTQHDRINMTKVSGLAGKLLLNTAAYDPTYLTPHDIIQSSDGLMGSFESVSGMVLSPTKYLAVTYPTGKVRVTAAIPGDANLDGSVNITDFAILGANYNATGTWINGSFNGDQLINISDFALLASNFNTSVTASLPRGAAIPEPASALAAIAGCLLSARRRRK